MTLPAERRTNGELMSTHGGTARVQMIPITEDEAHRGWLDTGRLHEEHEATIEVKRAHAVREYRKAEQLQTAVDASHERGREAYRTAGNATTASCRPAFCLNEHDAPADTVRIEAAPAVVYGGGYAQLSTWARNTLLIAAGSVCVALLLGIVYLITSGWPHLVAGLRNLSSW